MSQSYEEYLKENGINKNKPAKIQWSDYDRGFYCPTCNFGTTINAKKCKHCGQILLPYLNI